jgi:capsular exopolysaccharide synthesis family protein
LEELEAKIGKVTGQIDEITASLADLTSAAEIQDAEDRIEALEQVKTRYQAAYADLLAVSTDESPNALSLFQPAVVPGSPVPRQTNLIVAVSGAAGMGLAAGAVLLMEYLDTTLRWGKEGKQVVEGLRVLGAIPQISRRDNLSLGDPLSPIANAIRGLWVSVFLMDSSRRYTTLVLTSPRGGEGKSFIVANMAVALAAAGNRVIAIDADMRRPTLHQLYSRPNIVGLSEMLSRVGEVDWDTVDIPLRETGFEGLRLLSAGRTPADPVALLTSSTHFPALLETLRKDADIILIDSPPVLDVPDARVIATLVEGAILVVSEGTTSREAARRAKESLLAQEGVNLLGVAVNRVGRSSAYDYYSSYGSKRKAKSSRRRKQGSVDGGLTPAEVADILGLNQSMVLEWCKDGRLPATKQGLWWRVDRGRFAQMLEDTWDVRPRSRRVQGEVEQD